MNEKLLQMLGIARRAGKLSLGHDAAKTAVTSSKARLCILASDASERLEREFANLSSSARNPLPVVRLKESMEQLHKSIGAKAGVLTVNDEGFANRLQELSTLLGEETAYDD